jgi:alanyl-tRNA synthetase
MTGHEIRSRYVAFFEKRGHKVISSAPLVLENDSTTLFTSSGMQPLVPYLLGEPHPQGTKLVNSQPSLRVQDIEEVGDNRHTTFFEMLGNWSLGDYFKKEQLPWIFEFLTNKEEGLGLDPQRLYVSVFEGNEFVPKDEESIGLWENIFESVGIEAREGERILTYSAKKNWWSRSGTPEQMPAGEIGGPDSEIFYDFGEAFHFHEQSQWRNEPCHPKCWMWPARMSTLVMVSPPGMRWMPRSQTISVWR